MINIRKIRENNFKGLIEPCEEGENIITKIARILDENEPIGDGAPLIYTKKQDGVKPEYDIRTDKWDIAMQAMDRVAAYKVSEYLKDDHVTSEELEKGKKEGGEDPQTPNPVRDN